MPKITQLSEIKLMGITCRTNNKAEMDPSTSKIAYTVHKYLHDKLAEKLVHRKSIGTTYCAYAEYESDHTGDYTFFVGEEVKSFDDIPPIFAKLIVPVQSYAILTAGPGAMPDVCISTWQKIWQMSAEKLGGARKYVVDFEIYDQRALDPNNTTLDIYVGIK